MAPIFAALITCAGIGAGTIWSQHLRRAWDDKRWFDFAGTCAVGVAAGVYVIVSFWDRLFHDRTLEIMIGVVIVTEFMIFIRREEEAFEVEMKKRAEARRQAKAAADTTDGSTETPWGA
jgi:tetrahydromethanopterin S-methyltransferase subunit E